MSAFFGNMMIAITPSISTTSTSASADSDTSDIDAVAKGGRGNFTYTWNTSGTSATVISNKSSKTKIRGSSNTGKTTAYCTISDVITGNTVITPTVDVNWTAVIILLTASTITGSAIFNGNSQTVLVIDGINAPSGSYSGATSISAIDAGTYKTSITGTGNYSGSVEGTLTISRATITFEGPVEGTFTPLVYNGTTQSIPYTIGGAARGNDNYTILGTSGMDAKTYTATITTTYSNYVISSVKNSFTWTINKAGATISINPVNSSTANSAAGSFTISTSPLNLSYTTTIDVTGTGSSDAVVSQTSNTVNVSNKSNSSGNGFVVSVSVVINETNYTSSSANSSITFSSYTTPEMAAAQQAAAEAAAESQSSGSGTSGVESGGTAGSGSSEVESGGSGSGGGSSGGSSGGSGGGGFMLVL